MLDNFMLELDYTAAQSLDTLTTARQMLSGETLEGAIDKYCLGDISPEELTRVQELEILAKCCEATFEQAQMLIDVYNSQKK